ncbi:MAG TPA: thioesterase family protein, partial [Pseudomonas sp.]|uniref:thioesterase family protein n=1 Tax=Pseudomonas sp. TaxID=306 RepID=UPI002EDAD44D
NSLFTLEAHINYLHEVTLDEHVEVRTLIVAHDKKRVQLYHSLHRLGSDETLAASEQMLLHVDLAGGAKSALFSEQSLGKLADILERQVDQPAPAYIGRVIGLPPQR